MVKRVRIEDIVRVRDGRHSCPHCEKPMRYKKVSRRMLKWSPLEYAWFCERGCPTVWLDGSIDPEESTWDTRMKEGERQRMLEALSSSLSKKKARD